MRHRKLIAAIGLVIAAPLIFAALGGTERAGLIVGVTLVAVGVGTALAGTRNRRNGGD